MSDAVGTTVTIGTRDDGGGAKHMMSVKRFILAVHARCASRNEHILKEPNRLKILEDEVRKQQYRLQVIENEQTMNLVKLGNLHLHYINI